MKDSNTSFTSSNGSTTTSQIEWEVVCSPKKDHAYPERKGLPKEQWRHPVPISEFMAEGGLVETQANSKLHALGHSLLIAEEVIAGRLCIF